MILRPRALLLSASSMLAFAAVPAAGQTPEASASSSDDQSTSREIVVTAQRRAERIQDVPIAISAFTQESLDSQKIEGGADLLKALPNVTFSKNNFSGYNFAIRGIGTKAISVATDPGVAISFNSTTLITNRLFEQEFYDIDRVEVLRGPQGTLYGRNATGGVVNIIANVADPSEFDGQIKGEVGNYDTRRASGFVNIPLIPDLLALRVAASYTKRSGFTFNDITENEVDGRDLWSTRSTLSIKPSSTLRADLIWEHFDEDDNRSRTGKQLCHRDPGPESIGGFTNLSPSARGILSQGCKPGSLYTDEAYGTPNGLSLPYVILGADSGGLGTLGRDANGRPVQLITPGVDPYAGITQSRDLRRISSVADPIYRAKADVFQFNATWDVAENLSLVSQTTYNRDKYYSSQDLNRFNTQPVFNNSQGLTSQTRFGVVPAPNITPGGFYNDPQLGRSNRLVGYDMITAKTSQFSQELRVATSGSGPLQFTAGANYTRYRNETDYYVFVNAVTALLQLPNSIIGNWSEDPTKCFNPRGTSPDPQPIGSPGTAGCVYIDPNPLASINGEGHNYYRNANRYKLKSFGIFADGNYSITPELKIIFGLRYNHDNKVTTPIPSQLLLSTRPALGGTVDRGYPEDPDIRQRFTAFTGRAGIQWSPQVDFAKDLMIYGTYSRGYKAGGTNPPGIGFAKVNPINPNLPPIAATLTYPDRFGSEFVNAYEVGAKSTLLDGRMTLNLTGYYYDFSNYQVSQIIDRTAINENFDATTYGLEVETTYEPVEGLLLNANMGYQKTRIGNGEESIDVLDRTQGNSDYLVVKPFPLLASNCVVQRSVVEAIIAGNRTLGQPDAIGLYQVCPGTGFSSTRIPASAFPNDGRGFYADVSGNELPNAPQFTFNLGAEYTIPLATDWYATLRGDYYRQSKSFSRVYNTEADRLRGWDNVNLSLRIGNPEKELAFEFYVKNVFNKSPITDSFVNSDDSGLTTNVFVFDPRLIGFNVTKKF